MRPSPLKILLVDDEVMILRALARRLRGHQLRFATDVRSALLELQSESADVVLSDFNMPGGDGVALLEAVRRLFPGTRRALMSSDPPPYLSELMLSGVIERFLPKPLEGPLERVLRALVGGSERLQPVASAPWISLEDLN